MRTKHFFFFFCGNIWVHVVESYISVSASCELSVCPSVCLSRANVFSTALLGTDPEAATLFISEFWAFLFYFSFLFFFFSHLFSLVSLQSPLVRVQVCMYVCA